MTHDVQVIENDFWQIGILPQTGASTAFGRIKHNGQWVDVFRPTDPADYDNSSNCASFLLVPWSNRIRDGRFDFDGKTVQLDARADGNAIHGVVRDLPWTVDSVDQTHIQLSFDSANHNTLNFPFAFQSTATFRLQDNKFLMLLSLKNTDNRPFPAGFGHHPYFVRTINGDEVQVEIPCDRMFELTDKMADAAPVPVTDRLDFRKAKPLGSAEIDNILTGKDNNQPVRLIYADNGFELHLNSGDIFKHIILYAPDGKPFYAVEPVSNTNDGFNLFAKGIAGSGVFVLKPNEETNGAFVIDLHTTP
ncbi:MAG: hypothetical protein RLP44_15650 [Aggregatilineales bacterium]